jgi:hypothetical protein
MTKLLSLVIFGITMRPFLKNRIIRVARAVILSGANGVEESRGIAQGRATRFFDIARHDAIQGFVDSNRAKKSSNNES